MGYKTEQKEALTQYLASQGDRQFTLKELAEELVQVADIGTSTIYRLMDHLIQDGVVRRFTIQGSRKFYYQYMRGECHAHLHLKCTICGGLFHLNGMVSDFIQKQVLASHKFRLDEQETLLFGVCQTCQDGK